MKRNIIIIWGCILIAVIIVGCGENNTEADESEVSASPAVTAEPIDEEISPETEKVKLVNEIERGGIEHEYNTESALVKGDLFLQIDEPISDNAELISLYSNAGLNLYYCKENVEGETGLEYIKGQLVLEKAEIQYVFDVDFQYDYMTENLLEYEEGKFPYVHSGDYDGDGETEIVLTAVLDYGSGGMRWTKFFVIDYSNEMDSYNLYCLGINNFSDVLDTAVMEYYKQQFDLDYTVIYQKKDEYEGSEANFYECYMGAENGNPVKFGDITVCSVVDSIFSIDVTVYEVYGETAEFPEEAGGAPYYWMGECSFEISYAGDGVFAVKPSKYIENRPW